MDDRSEGKAEVVIVRRRGADDGGAGKAGAWKIAYADFVTAMMAFFLVMWLINASNEETRAQVASYFNPIKLTDTSTGARSVKDTKESKNAQRSDQKEAVDAEDGPTETALMSDPLKALDRVAEISAGTKLSNAGVETRIEISPAVEPDTSNPGVGDPFDPQSWKDVTRGVASISDETPSQQLSASSTDTSLSRQVEGSPVSPSDVAASPDMLPDGERQVEKPVEPPHGSRSSGEEAAAAIEKEIAVQLGMEVSELQQSVSVTPSSGGILVSLTERENFEMFASGSAEPRPDTMRLVEAIAASLRSRDGGLVIRGHTDSRPFRNAYYDNWQLSTARAHFAQYMLIRSGLDESRIHRIEGVADRELRNKDDPQAPENRRIDILIMEEKP